MVLLDGERQGLGHAARFAEGMAQAEREHRMHADTGTPATAARQTIRVAFPAG